jgi:hypothetical protein
MYRTRVRGLDRAKVRDYNFRRDHSRLHDSLKSGTGRRRNAAGALNTSRRLRGGRYSRRYAGLVQEQTLKIRRLSDDSIFLFACVIVVKTK